MLVRFDMAFGVKPKVSQDTNGITNELTFFALTCLPGAQQVTNSALPWIYFQIPNMLVSFFYSPISFYLYNTSAGIKLLWSPIKYGSEKNIFCNFYLQRSEHWTLILDKYEYLTISYTYLVIINIIFCCVRRIFLWMIIQCIMLIYHLSAASLEYSR